MIRRSVVAVIFGGLALGACGDKGGGADVGGTDATSGDGGTESGLGGSSSSGAPASSGTASSATASSGGGIFDPTGTTGDTGAVFIEEPDAGVGDIDCDLWMQDCPMGEKCMPYANDGGNAWNAAKCTELAASPKAVGDECKVEGSGVSGRDDCEGASMCWSVGEMGTGVCAAFCGGSPDSPTCDDPETACTKANEGVLNLCLPKCDPLAGGCPDGEACYIVMDEFVCAPDTAEPSLGGYGDPCEYINSCHQGLFCARASAVPGCGKTGATGCCTQWCDLKDPAGSAQCEGAPDQECTPAFEEGNAPVGFQDLGACAIPAP